MYVNIIIYSNELLLFVWSTLKKEKKKKISQKVIFDSNSSSKSNIECITELKKVKINNTYE